MDNKVAGITIIVLGILIMIIGFSIGSYKITEDIGNYSTHTYSPYAYVGLPLVIGSGVLIVWGIYGWISALGYLKGSSQPIEQ